MDDWTCGRCKGRNTDLYKGRRREKCTSCYLSRDKAKVAEVPQPRQGELLPQPAPNKDEGAGVLDYEWTREKAAARQLPPLAVHTTASAAPECAAASRTSGVSRHHPTTVASSLPLRRASLTSAAAALQHAPYLCPQQQQ